MENIENIINNAIQWIKTSNVAFGITIAISLIFLVKVSASSTINFGDSGYIFCVACPPMALPLKSTTGVVKG